MRKILFVFLFFLQVLQIPCLAEDTEINSSILSVNPDQDFFIIRSGEDAGIEIGDGLIVHRGDEKLAEAYIIEVRPAVSAAEVLSVESGKDIREGDEILIVKRSEPFPAEARVAYERSSSGDIMEGETIGLDISNKKNSVFTYANVVLRENGFSVVSSNRVDGIILANKPMELSLLKELWADATAAIGHNLVISIDIKEIGNSSALTVSSFGEHFQKGRHIKKPINKDSKYYPEIIDVLSKIKERSEY